MIKREDRSGFYLRVIDYESKNFSVSKYNLINYPDDDSYIINGSNFSREKFKKRFKLIWDSITRKYPEDFI